MSETEDAARAALRERQGVGARYDAAAAPARSLDWARRGTAYFARLLNELSDAELDAPSMLSGLSRRHVVAHIGYHARILSEIVAWARTGQEGSFPKAVQVDAGDIARGATLPSHALRYLFHHSEVHLNVEWRDLSDAGWDACVEDAAGRRLKLRETPEIRARALWLHAVDLGAGGRFADMPPDFVDALIRHLADSRSGKAGLALAPSDRREQIVAGGAPQLTVNGKAADIARWMTGRGAERVQFTGGRSVPGAPPPGLVEILTPIVFD